MESFCATGSGKKDELRLPINDISSRYDLRSADQDQSDACLAGFDPVIENSF
jgi:hypothetical protein